MNRLKRIESLFHQALELEKNERLDFVKRECGSDQGLANELWALLESDQTRDDFMEEPAMAAYAGELSTIAPNVGEGSVLGRHRLLSPIGVGGMGSVYKACDTQTGDIVAVKILAPHLASTDSAVRRFFREAKAAAALKHPAIAQVLDFGEQEGVFYIAMEYVEGQTLRESIGRGQFSWKQTGKILLQVVDALSEAHRKGIVHRDLKPSNLMITEAGKVKTLDFGLVKVQRGIGLHAGGGISADTLTLPGTVLGTLNYMSPEQAMGKDIDHRSDIFSLGIIAYEMLTGRLPFQGKTLGETLDSICHAAYQPIARFDWEASEKFETIVGKCLRKDPLRRYRSVKELGKDLEKACGYASSDRAAFLKRNKRLLFGAAALMFALVLFVAWWIAFAS
jgi:serine/threonine protein kinase